MELTNHMACNVSIALGLTISMCTADGIEIGRLRSLSTPESSRPDIRTRPASQSTVHVEALTPDGQAFIDLMVEA